MDWRLIVFASHYTYYSLEDLVTLQMHKRIFYFVRDAHDPRVHWEVWSDKVVGAGESIMGAVDGWQTIANSPGEAFGQLPGGVVLAWDGTKQQAGRYADSARKGDEAFVRTTLKGTISFSIDTIIGKYFDDYVMPRVLPKAPDAPAGTKSGAMDTAKGGELILDEAGEVLPVPDGPEIPFQVIDDLADSVDDLPPLPAPPPPTPDLSWPVTPDGQPLPTSGLTQAQIDAGDVGHMPLSWFRAQKRFAIPDEFPDLAPGMRDWTPQEWADHIDYLLSNEGAYGIAPGVRVVPPRKGTVPTRLQIHSNSCLLECFRSVLVALKQRLPSSKSLQYHSQRLDDWKGKGLDPDALENLIESGKPLRIFDDGLMVGVTEIRNAPSPFETLEFMHKNLKNQEWIIRLEWKKADGTPDGGHAVRLEGIEGDKVFISDPGLPPGVSLEIPKVVFDKLATHVWNLTVAQ